MIIFKNKLAIMMYKIITLLVIETIPLIYFEETLENKG
jgi:hypothetical protein